MKVVITFTDTEKGCKIQAEHGPNGSQDHAPDSVAVHWAAIVLKFLVKIIKQISPDPQAGALPAPRLH